MKHIKTPSEFLEENRTYIRNGYKYTKFLSDGKIDYDLVETLDNKTIGIQVYFMRKLIGSITIGILDEQLVEQSDEYYQIINKNPFIYNVSIIDEFKNKGIATKLYELIFYFLKNDGYNKVYSGRTRNSMYINNIWEKLSDGFETINGHSGIIKIYYKNL